MIGSLLDNDWSNVQAAFEDFGQGQLFDNDPRRDDGNRIHMMDGQLGTQLVGYHRWHAAIRVIQPLEIGDNEWWENLNRLLGLAWAIQSFARPRQQDMPNPALADGDLQDLRTAWLALTPDRRDRQYDVTAGPCRVPPFAKTANMACGGPAVAKQKQIFVSIFLNAKRNPWNASQAELHQNEVSQSLSGGRNAPNSQHRHHLNGISRQHQYRERRYRCLTNRMNMSHTVTADNGEFDSGVLGQDQSFSHTFDAVGSVDYHCEIHPDMTGKISISSPVLNTHIIEITTMMFPANTPVAVGDTVVWTNRMNMSHTVTADNGEFDSGVLGQDQSFSHTFDAVGSV